VDGVLHGFEQHNANISSRAFAALSKSKHYLRVLDLRLRVLVS